MTQININNISINYQLEGEGKTIVFIHGLSDSLYYWEVLSSSLKNKYKILRFDLRGHGNSTDNDEKTTINLYQDDLYHLLKELKIEKATFIGLSLGGNIAMDFAIKHPEMVSGLIIMSSFCEYSPKLEKIFDDFLKGIDQGFVEFFDVILPYTIPEEMIEESREELESFKYIAAETANVEGIKKGIKAGYELNLTDKLNRIDAPTLVIAGKDDDLTDLDAQKKISDNIKNSKLIVLEGTKHNILIGKNIGTVLDIINDFMEKIEVDKDSKNSIID